MGLAGEKHVSCHTREHGVMHELLHAHRHLLVAVCEQFESSRLGDSVKCFGADMDDVFEVPETWQGRGVDGECLVRSGEGRRLLLPRKEVEMFAA